MFNVKFETKGYKYFLKMGGWVDGREVCLSSDTPEDDDIKDVVINALEAYHEYQGDKLKNYMEIHYKDYYYMPGGINNNTKDFDMVGVEKALVELVYNDHKSHEPIKDNTGIKAKIDRLCSLNDQLVYRINYFVKQNKIVIPKACRDDVFKHVLSQVLEKCKSEPNHTPQPYTQKLLDCGVLKFSETFGKHEYYNTTSNYIINYCSDETNIKDSTVSVFVEVYDEDNIFNFFKCMFYDNTANVHVTPNDLLIYQVMEV